MVRAETLKFQEKGVKDIIKDVFLPWYNAHRFLVQNIQQMERVSSLEQFIYSGECLWFNQETQDSIGLSLETNKIIFSEIFIESLNSEFKVMKWVVIIVL